MSSAARRAHRTQLFGEFGLVHEIVQEGLVHGGAEPNGTDGSAAPQDAAWSDDCLLYRPNEHRKGKGAKAITSEQLDAFLTFMRATSAYITHTSPVESAFDISYFTIPYDFQSSVVLNGFSIFSLFSFQTFAERKEKRAIHSGAVLKEKERPEQNGHVRREARRATGARALR